MSIKGIQGSVKTYLFGLLVCSLLTLLPYYIVVEHLLTGWHALWAIVAFGILQALVQLILFLHLGDEDKPRWNLMSFLFMALILVVIVFGSLWIMFNLNERTMSQMDHMHHRMEE